jgi:hypothetical protein
MVATVAACCSVVAGFADPIWTRLDPLGIGLPPRGLYGIPRPGRTQLGLGCLVDYRRRRWRLFPPVAVVQPALIHASFRFHLKVS